MTMGFRQDIQGLRGIAVLLVVAYHTGGLVPGGFVGVDVFFVISGYVITGVLRREASQTGSVSLRRFYRRRIRRLMPATALATIVTIIGFALVADPRSELTWAVRTAAASTLFSSNLYLAQSSGGYFTPAAESNPFLHTWSLSLEEQIYFVYPALVGILVWQARRTFREKTVGRLMIPGFLAIAVLSIIVNVSMTHGLSPFSTSEGWVRLAFYTPVARAWEFLVGALLAWSNVQIVRRRSVLTAQFFGVGLLVIAAVLFDSSTTFPGLAAVIPVVGTALLLVPTASSTIVSRASSCRLLGWVGDRSYSWYLWHWPAIVIVGILRPGTGWALAAAVAALVPAVVSYRYLELPIRSGRIISHHTGRLALVAVGLPIIAIGAVEIGGQRNWGLEVPEGWADVRLAGQMGCVDTPGVTWPSDRCVVAADTESNGIVLVLGDSHASSLSDGAAAAFTQMGYDTAFWAKSGCPFLVGRTTVGNPGCAEWQGAALDLIDSLEPAAVVVVNRSAGYVLPEFPPGESWRTIGNASGQLPLRHSEALEQWRTGVQNTVRAIEAAGTRALWVSIVPEYFEGFRVSLVDPEPQPPSVSPAERDARRGAVIEIETEVVGESPVVHLYDPAEVLCSDAGCRAGDGDDWWYMDGHHLNPVGSRLLTDSLRGAMTDLLVE